MLFTTKEIVVLVIGTGLAFASFKAEDPLIFFPCIGISWAAFVYICVSHESALIPRVIVALLISGAFVLISFRTYKHPTENGAVAHLSYADMTNAQLRHATEGYVARLRKFNNESIRADKREQDESFDNLRKGIPNDKKQAWESYSQRSDERRQKYESAFRDNFLTDARMLDEELRKRVDPRALVPGRTGPPMSSDTALLGHLSGPTGMLLNELAVRLETLVKQLPDDD